MFSVCFSDEKRLTGDLKSLMAEAMEHTHQRPCNQTSEDFQQRRLNEAAQTSRPTKRLSSLASNPVRNSAPILEGLVAQDSMRSYKKSKLFI
jgi:hypothetical protein